MVSVVISIRKMELSGMKVTSDKVALMVSDCKLMQLKMRAWLSYTKASGEKDSNMAWALTTMTKTTYLRVAGIWIKKLRA